MRKLIPLFVLVNIFYFGRGQSNRSFQLFAETRENPIHITQDIPAKWTQKKGDDNQIFQAFAQPGEFFFFQIGVWAKQRDLKDIQVSFSDFKTRSGKVLPRTRLTCINEGGIDSKGRPFNKKVSLDKGKIAALWMGMDLENAVSETYEGQIKVSAEGETQVVSVAIIVAGKKVENHGYNEGYRLSRLNWLNSTIGIDDEITRGYVPVQIKGNIVDILGRSLEIAPSGLPAKIQSYFTHSNQCLSEKGSPIVRDAFRFVIERENGEIIRLNPEELQIIRETPSLVVWRVNSTSNLVDLECSGQMEFDGFVDYHIKLIARKELRLKDVRLEIPIVPDEAEYLMGLGHEGGWRTPDWTWKWDVNKNQDMLWIGNVGGGLRFKWRAENYVRPLINIYYKFGPLALPPSWDNNGKGGVVVRDEDNEVVVNAYSGARKMSSGEELNYDFEMLITPLKVLDKQIKYGDRYYHMGGTNTSVKVANAKKLGANILNIHHAEDIYPFINYPYLDDNVGLLSNLADQAHQENIRLKVYYTTRELTKNLPEFWAFYSLNGEVIYPGPGNASRTEALHPNGPNQWLIDSLKENYIPAWYNLVKEGKFRGELDLSVITTPDSRLNNFYIAGLNWMMKNMHIDGVYIDDSALDRFTMRRARKVIDRNCSQGTIDLHSWNHFNAWAGYANCLNLYMDLLPYFDLVWIGEGRNYDRAPDHWLIEVSGIPFGLPGQMLQGGGNPWRGMIYGITNRAGFAKVPPTHIWEFWDEHSFEEKELSGYWDEHCPVRSDSEAVKASIYTGERETIISVANWHDQDEQVNLSVDWKALGMNPAKVEISIPAIQDFQSAVGQVSLSNMTIPAKRGYLILLKSLK